MNNEKQGKLTFDEVKQTVKKLKVQRYRKECL